MPPKAAKTPKSNPTNRVFGMLVIMHLISCASMEAPKVFHDHEELASQRRHSNHANARLCTHTCVASFIHCNCTVVHSCCIRAVSCICTASCVRTAASCTLVIDPCIMRTNMNVCMCAFSSCMCQHAYIHAWLHALLHVYACIPHVRMHRILYVHAHIHLCVRTQL